ncbi:MAG: NAD(P)H-hydrate dehydratase [Alphaproteobacteria bacterium]|nr:NAD(P)H-hydrate dehydratase [Alphaproteobacteria bacterium]
MSAEIITVAQMRAIDTRSAELGVPTLTLMENAGTAVADAIMERFSPRPTAVLCGPGDNGGDGFVVARKLKRRGWPVWVETLSDPRALRRDAAEMANRWGGDTMRIAPENPMAELFVDALFGAGISRPLESDAARLARGLARTPERVVAVDVPSGLNGDTAKPLGELCFRAGLTVTFVRKKPAHVLLPGRAFCGEVVVADIGAHERAVADCGAKAWESGPAMWGKAFPWPDPEAHKHARGHVMVWSGPPFRTGAARLAARGALRAGAGLVTVLGAADALAVHAAHTAAIMLAECDGAESLRALIDQARAAVIGPAAGVGEATKANVLAALDGSTPLVLDADALTVFQDNPAELFSKLRAFDVMTPHVGEFRRIFGGLLGAEPTRIEAVRKAAERAGCVVLLKGPDTTIAAPDERCCVNAAGTPFLATAGSGDVLAGVIAGLIAQGVSSFDAASAGAWLHARAGETVGAGLIAEDLPEALPHVLDQIAPEGLKRR